MLVVVTREAGPVRVAEGDAVRVTGEVQLPFRIADVERGYGVELEDDAVDQGRLGRYRGQEYLAASAVASAEPEEGR